jgi:hypothetical protein
VSKFKKLEGINRKNIADFYREQLVKFDKIGIGNDTENGVEVTDKLIEMTKKRLGELTISRSQLLINKIKKENNLV